jgi:hypothetical protein
MSDIGTMAFEACYAALPEARATATFGRVTVTRAICTEVGSTRALSEIGGGQDVSFELRYLVAEDVPAKCGLGAICALIVYGQTVATSYRVVTRALSAGVIILTLEAVNG